MYLNPNSLPLQKEGDVLIIEDDTYTIDKDETDTRRREIQDLMNKLFE